GGQMEMLHRRGQLGAAAGDIRMRLGIFDHRAVGDGAGRLGQHFAVNPDQARMDGSLRLAAAGGMSLLDQELIGPSHENRPVMESRYRVYPVEAITLRQS